MSSTLYRLGRAMARARWKAVGAWVLLLIVLGSLAGVLGGQLTEQFEIPGTEGQQGIDQLATRFPEMGGASGQLVFVSTDGQDIEAHHDQIEAAIQDAAEVDGVATAADPFAEVSPGTRSADGTAIIGNVQMDGELGSFPAEAPEQLTEIADRASTDGLTVSLGGQILQATSLPFSIAEVMGVLAALIVLAITFRAILPAVIPITTAVVGVGVSMTALLALAAGVDIPSVTPTLAIMLGLAVGIDYALFIVSRHRDQLRRGEDVEESIGEAIATSGSAVIFAGLTVIIALVGLFVTRIPFLTLMGLASAVGVGIAVIIALTLLPAILGIFGERLRPRRIRGLMAENGGVLPEQPHDAAPAKPGFFGHWVRIVTRVPLLTIIIVVLGLGALTLPAKDMRLALPDLGTERPGTQARDTYDLISEKFGPGYNGPLLVTADIINTDDPLGVMDELEERITDLGDVQEIQLATPNRGADMGVVVVIPKGGQTDESTSALVHDIRDHADEWEKDLKISDIRVTGQTAVGIDISERLTSALLPFALFVVGLSLILLTMVFRSIWVPIKASLGYLLSVGAAFGVVAMVFQYGWGNDLLNIHVVGPVISFMPIMVMGVLFGLAMDYEVFLVSRMREEFVHTGDANGSIRRGFVSSAPVVVAAALIMFAVFASFVPEGTFMIQPISVALAVGVAIDAFVVRMTLVPAVLALLGDRAWRLPRWLERLLPRLDIEGEGLKQVLEHRAWTQEHGDAAVRFQDVIAPLPGDAEHLGPLTGSVPPGSVLVVRSEDPAAVRTFLGLVSGRVLPARGLVAVHDRLIPDDLGAIQSGCHVIPAGSDVGARLRAIPARAVPGRLIVVDRVEDLVGAGPESGRLLESMLERGATLLTGSVGLEAERAEQRLPGLLGDPERIIALGIEPREGAAPDPSDAPSEDHPAENSARGAVDRPVDAADPTEGARA